MLPNIAGVDINISTTSTATQGKSFKFDFATGEFELIDGKMIEITEREVLKIWIQKTIRTEKNKFKVYQDVNYGVSIEDLVIGRAYNQQFINSELEREISEALTQNKLIQSISDFSSINEGKNLIVSFTVNNSFRQEVTI